MKYSEISSKLDNPQLNWGLKQLLFSPDHSKIENRDFPGQVNWDEKPTTYPQLN